MLQYKAVQQRTADTFDHATMHYQLKKFRSRETPHQNPNCSLPRIGHCYLVSL